MAAAQASAESVLLEPARLTPVQGHIAPMAASRPALSSRNNPYRPVHHEYLYSGRGLGDQNNANRLSQSLASFGAAKIYPTFVNPEPTASALVPIQRRAS